MASMFGIRLGQLFTMLFVSGCCVLAILFWSGDRKDALFFTAHAADCIGGVACAPNGVCTVCQTFTGGTTGVVQKYPTGGLSISAQKNSGQSGDLIMRTSRWTYTTHAPRYPGATLDINIDIPSGLAYVSGSFNINGEGDFLGSYENAGDIVFVVKLLSGSAVSTSVPKIYTGIITFTTKVLRTPSTTGTVIARMVCYGLPPGGYTGTVSCSHSPSAQGAFLMQEETMSISLNKQITTGALLLGTGIQNKVCGNGVLETSEQCDDGNAISDDGCSSGCVIEKGRRCLATSPSQCGSDDCFTHGEVFSETNIFGTCCGGLREIVVSPTSSVVTGVVKSHICYDPMIGQPLCDTRASPAGWRIPIETASGNTLVMKDSCRSIYKDYYKQLLLQLQGMQPQCLFTDIPYDQVVFKDIRSTKQRVAIQTLRDACLVQGIDQDFDTFGPNRPIQRAELIKMVVKLLMIAESDAKEDSKAPEIGVYSGGIQFFDVSPTFWGAWYIDEAARRGLLSARSNNGIMTFFKPYASVSHEEFIALMRRLEAGQIFSRTEMETVIGKKIVVSRAAAAELLVKKFLVYLHPYFYFKGDQEEYYWRLAEELRGKNYQQQYSIILSQIDKLHQQDEHGSPVGWDTNKLNPYWMQQFLRQFIY